MRRIHCNTVRIVVVALLLFGFPSLVSAMTIHVHPTNIDHADSSHENSIAAAINRLHQNGGGTVQLSEGTYRVSESLVLQDNIRIFGAGMNTVIRLSNKGADHIFNNAYSDDKTSPGIRNVVIRDLTLIGRKSVRKNCIQIIARDAKRSEYIGVINVAAQYCGRHGVHIKGANVVKVRNLHLRNNGDNIYHDHNLYLLRVTDAVVDNINTATSNGNGFSSTRLENARLSRMYSFLNGNRGLRFGAGKNIVVKGCLSQHNSQLSRHNADGITITSDDELITSEKVAIVGCRVSNNEGHGIFADSAAGVQVRDSMIHDNGFCGVANIKSQVQLNNSKLNNNAEEKNQKRCMKN